MEALVAFGLYMQAECIWAQEQTNPPSVAEWRRFHDNQSTSHSFERARAEAHGLLQDYVRVAVRTQVDDVLGQAVETATEAVYRSARSHFAGVVDALLGAFAWTLFLILISLCLRFAGIDVLEVLHRVSSQTPAHLNPSLQHRVE